MKEGRRHWLTLNRATALAGATDGAVGAWVAPVVGCIGQRWLSATGRAAA